MDKNKINPKFDLMFERILDVPVELVWKAWTDPKHVVHWFTPEPWKTTACDIDLRPGGKFRTVMASPEGQEMENTGCFLEIVENKKLVWTDAMGEDFRPSAKSHPCFEGFFTACVLMEPFEGKTKYTAIVLHSNEADRKEHEGMGFYAGWGKAAEQLEAYMKTV